MGCNSTCARITSGQRSESQLTTLFGDSTIQAVAPIDARPARKKRSWLPLLTVLFCLSYGLMTMLIVEQGVTIESQRALIQDMFHDSSELSAMRMKAQRDRTAARRAQNPSGQAQAPSNQAPTMQAPSTQAPANQAPSIQAQNQAPSSQAAPAQNSAGKTKSQFRMPSRPAADISDARRVLVTI